MSVYGGVYVYGFVNMSVCICVRVYESVFVWLRVCVSVYVYLCIR